MALESTTSIYFERVHKSGPYLPFLWLRGKMYCQMSSYANLGKTSWRMEKNGGKRIKTIFLRRCSFTFPSTIVPYISSSFPGDISKCGCSSICHHAFIQSCNRKSFLLNVKISRYDHSSICDFFPTLQK